MIDVKFQLFAPSPRRERRVHGGGDGGGTALDEVVEPRRRASVARGVAVPSWNQPPFTPFHEKAQKIDID